MQGMRGASRHLAGVRHGVGPRHVQRAEYRLFQVQDLIQVVKHLTRQLETEDHEEGEKLKGDKSNVPSQDIDIRLANLVELSVGDLQIARESLVLQERSKEMSLPAESITSIRLIQREWDVDVANGWDEIGFESREAPRGMDFFVRLMFLPEHESRFWKRVAYSRPGSVYRTLRVTCPTFYPNQ